MPVESFTNHIVAMTAVYHNMLAMARNVSYQHGRALPCISAEFHSALQRHLLSEKRNVDAIKIAKLSGYSEESVDNQAMLESILVEGDGLSDLERAELLWEYGDRVRLISGGGTKWRESLQTTAELYDMSGHATGALDIRIDLLTNERGDENSLAEDIAELWRIKEVMESAGNWASVKRCLAAIIAIHTMSFVVPPESLQVMVEEEWLQMIDICSSRSSDPVRGQGGTEVGSMSASMAELLGWQSLQPRTAKGLGCTERLYQKVNDSDEPAMVSIVLITLHHIHKSIGEEAKALECLARRPETLPRELVVLLNLDSFETALRSTTEAPDAEHELQLLRDELEKVQSRIRQTPLASARVLEIQRLCNLVEGWQATIWRSKALQHRVMLPQLKSQSATTAEEIRVRAQEALQYYQRALDLLEASGHNRDWRTMTAKIYVANSQKLLWQLEGRPAVSEHFTAAAKLYAETVGAGSLGQEQMTCHLLLNLWAEGHDVKVAVDTSVFCHESVTTYEMLLKWVNEAERLETMQRNDLSALPRERAVLAKQRMNSKRNAQGDYHHMVLFLHDSVDDNVGAWN